MSNEEAIRVKEAEKQKLIHSFEDEQIQFSNKQVDEINVIAPRSCCKIQIKFTPRVFPTPCRESQDVQEREVLRFLLS